MTKGPADTPLAKATHEWRTDNGLSKVAAAAELGISVRTIKSWEAGGVVFPREAPLRRLVEASGKDRREILYGDTSRADRTLEEAMRFMAEEIARLREEIRAQ